MVKRKRKNKQFGLFKGIITFAVVTFFTWMLMEGLFELIPSINSPWTKMIIGFIGLFIAGFIGWRKF